MGYETYDDLVHAARGDPTVVGLVLTGSRGRADAPLHAGSDWDVRLVVRDGALGEARARYGTAHGSTVEVVVFEDSVFETVGLPGGADPWDRYSYVGVEVGLDGPGGPIASAVARKAALTADEARSIAAHALDDYINSLYRSRRNAALGLRAAAHLDAVESIGPFFEFLFAVHHRVRPFNKWLAWDLDRAPLPEPIWARPALLDRLERLAASGDVTDQIRLFRDVEAIARAHGHSDVVDGWEPDVPWLQGR